MITILMFFATFCCSFIHVIRQSYKMLSIRVITKLPNSEQSYKGKIKAHKYSVGTRFFSA